jgi:hypothetical protein
MMSEAKKAAIDLDEIGEKSLSEVSAADFLAALNAGGISVRGLTVWPEKKKVELWAEHEIPDEIRVKDFVRVINEKKKVEMEKDPRAEGWNKTPGSEDWTGQFGEEIYPGPYEQLLDRLTRDIESRLRQRMRR